MFEDETIELKKTIKEQAFKEIAKWSILGFIALFVTAITGWGLYLKPKIDKYIASASDSVPNGAVVAFLSSESEPCPGENWVIYNEAKGRFIVGAGNDSSNKLETRALGDPGGAESVALNINQIPSHTHRISTDKNQDVHDGLSGGSSEDKGILSTFSDIPNKPNWTTVLDNVLEKTGGNSNGETEKHSNMPPFIALYFCKKVK